MRAMRRVGSHLKNSKMICKSDWAASAAEVRIYNPATSFDGRIVPEVVRWLGEMTGPQSPRVRRLEQLLPGA